MELEDNALLIDPNLEQNLLRLQEEERQLLEQQTAMEAAGVDDIAALEHQDALRFNHLQQQELQKQQAILAQRQAQRQANAQGHSHEQGQAQALAHPQPQVLPLVLPLAHGHASAHVGAGQSQAQCQAHACAHGSAQGSGQGPRRDQPRRRATCTVRVNNLHTAEAIETDV